MLTPPQLESHLWEAANILRHSPVDRTDWKNYILPLLFFKRISDVWDEELAEVVEKYADAVNRKAGEFYTPRSVVRLMVDIPDPKEDESVYDPACGTGGMLLAAVAHVREAGGGRADESPVARSGGLRAPHDDLGEIVGSTYLDSVGAWGVFDTGTSCRRL